MYKIGQSKDIHKLIFSNKPLNKTFIGLVEINTKDHWIEATSDGDILIHSISESIIGALGLGDLGTHFSDQKSRDGILTGKEILLYVKKLLHEHKYKIVNIDSIVIYDHILLNQYIKSMKINISKILGINFDLLNIKATRSEGKSLNFIQSESIVLLQKN